MDKVATLKDKGNECLAANRLDEAIKHYSDAIELDESNHVLYSNRSAAYAKAGKYDLSLTDGEKTVELNPTWAKGYSRKAAALAYLGRIAESKATYEAGLAIEPNNAQLKEGLADLKASATSRASSGLGGLFGNYNPFAAPDVFQKLMADSTTAAYLRSPSYLTLLGELANDPNSIEQHLSDPRVVSTLSVLMNLGARPSASTNSSDSPSRSTPTAFTSRPPPTKAEPMETGDAGPSKEEAERASWPEHKRLAAEAKIKGNDAYKRKDFAAAQKHYDEAIKHDESDITFYNNKAAVYFEQKEYQKCIEVCEKGVEVGRENRADYKLIAKAFMRIGNAYKRLKDWKSAKMYYEKSMSEHRTPEIRTLLSDAEKQIKEEERRAYIDPVKAEEEKELGNEFFKKGDYANAVKHYTEAIKRNPEDAKYYSNRAACYTKLVAFDLGLKDCEECVRLDPNFIKGWIRKGHILHAMQQSTKAIAAFQSALELDPKNEEALNGYRTCTMSSMSFRNSSGSNQAGTDAEQVRQRAMADPEVQSILRDPAMRMILDQMQNDPRALQEHLKNPDIAAKIQKLLESGLIAIH